MEARAAVIDVCLCRSRLEDLGFLDSLGLFIAYQAVIASFCGKRIELRSGGAAGNHILD